MNNGSDSSGTPSEADTTELQDVYPEHRNLLDAEYKRMHNEHDNGGGTALPPNSPGQQLGFAARVAPGPDYGWPAWAQTRITITGTTTASHEGGSGGPMSPTNQVDSDAVLVRPDQTGAEGSGQFVPPEEVASKRPRVDFKFEAALPMPPVDNTNRLE